MILKANGECTLGYFENGWSKKAIVIDIYGNSYFG